MVYLKAGRYQPAPRFVGKPVGKHLSLANAKLSIPSAFVPLASPCPALRFRENSYLAPESNLWRWPGMNIELPLALMRTVGSSSPTFDWE
jgi:hypothetical protein